MDDFAKNRPYCNWADGSGLLVPLSYIQMGGSCIPYCSVIHLNIVGLNISKVFWNTKNG